MRSSRFIATTQSLGREEETPWPIDKTVCLSVSDGTRERNTYEHMGGADHVVVNGPSNVRAEAIVKDFCTRNLANLSFHLPGQFAVSVDGRDSSAQPAVDLVKYERNMVYHQMGNGKENRRWLIRFATAMSDSHLAQRRNPSCYLYGEAAMVSKQACWDFVWYSEVMMSPSRFAPWFGVTILAVNQNPSGQEEIPFRMINVFDSLNSNLLLQYWPSKFGT